MKYLVNTRYFLTSVAARRFTTRTRWEQGAFHPDPSDPSWQSCSIIRSQHNHFLLPQAFPAGLRPLGARHRGPSLASPAAAHQPRRYQEPLLRSPAARAHGVGGGPPTVRVTRAAAPGSPLPACGRGGSDYGPAGRFTDKEARGREGAGVRRLFLLTQLSATPKGLTRRCQVSAFAFAFGGFLGGCPGESSD